jgi:membrane peptidoglycan carboxypeptidase
MYVLGQIETHMNAINSQILSNARQRANQAGEDFDPSTVDLFTQELIDEARETELAYNPPVATNKLAGHFVDFVLAELQRKEYKDEDESFTLSELQTGGYKITTTLDHDLQTVAERYAEAAGNQYYYWNIHNAAVMTMAPDTGEIITMAGSKGFVGESQGCDENGANCLYNSEVNIISDMI